MIETTDHHARSSRNGLVSDAYDRMSLRRSDTAWLTERLGAVDTRFVPVTEEQVLVTSAEPLQACFVTRDQLSEENLDTESISLLGEWNGNTYFALTVFTENEALRQRMETLGRFADLRRIGPHLHDAEAAILAYARGISHWHQRHRYCGVCGYATRSSNAGYRRQCANCGSNQFPRIDPAIIVLVHDEERCLLGRRPAWAENRFSTIAGFVEPGESAEQAVVREVYEETAIRIGAVTYHSSQPWPFPGSLMLGFHAQSESEKIERLDGELAEARWFTRSEVLGAFAKRGPFTMPPALSISYRLIEDWAAP